MRRAREALAMLAEPGDGKPVLPPEELAEAAGLAFAFVNRGGALVSGMSGRGFLIRKACAGSCLHAQSWSAIPAKWSKACTPRLLWSMLG